VFDTGTNPPVTIQNSIVAGNMAVGSGSDLVLDPGSTLDFDFSLIGDNAGTPALGRRQWQPHRRLGWRRHQPNARPAAKQRRPDRDPRPAAR